MKKYLLTGLVLLLPFALTVIVIVFLFDFFTTPFDNLVRPLIELLQQKIPFILPHGFAIFLSRLLSLIFLCFFIFILGFITQWLLVKTLFSWGNILISRIPIVKTIYKVSREIFSALFATDGKKAFKEAVMVAFPHKSSYCLGFRAGETAAECQEKLPVPVASIFVPTAPHPISGFLILVPENEIHTVDMTNEETLKFLVSCGMIVPELVPERTPDEI